MEFKIAKTQDGSMPPAFRIEFYSPRLGNRQSAYVMAQTKNEAINKFFKEKPQYKGKIEIKSVTMLNARELPKQKALKVGDSEKTQDKSPLSFMDSVVRAFRDETFPPNTIVVGEFVREERPYKKLLKFSLSDYISTDKIRRELKERISQSEYYDKGEPYQWHLNEVKIKRPDENKYRKI